MTSVKKLPTLYKRAVNGKISEWTIETQENKYRTISGYVDGLKTITEWTVCSGKNIGRSNETTPESQALLEASAEWKKRIARGYFQDIASIDKSVIFKPMLANKWEDYENKVAFPIFSQPKLDGIRCIVKSDGMWTRTGKPILSAPHIFESLRRTFENYPDLILDGELYADKYANDFNAIVSLVKKTKPTNQDLIDSASVIEYHIYDMPSSDGTFTQRHKELCELFIEFEANSIQCLKMVATTQIHNMNDLSAYYYDYISAGYEGQMLRLDAVYENKRSKALLKHKSFLDEEYVIVGYEEGNGNLAGMIGALVFETKVGDRFTASVNGGWDFLKQLWRERESLVGKKATIAYFNITPDGKPRFPKVKAIRDYE